MPFPGRSILLAAAVAGAALGAGPALGARHHRAGLVVKKSHVHGHVPARAARRPLIGTLPAGMTPATTPTTADPVPTTPGPVCPAAIGVTEGEYYTHPSRTSVCPGPIVMELRNAGQDDHDMKVVDLDHGTVVATWAIAHPGDAVQKKLTLAAGAYTLFCTLTDGNGAHQELGMHADITVG